MESNYELLAFGAGRKIERFGSVILDRPSSAADRTRSHRVWPETTIDLAFDRVWQAKSNVGVKAIAEGWSLDLPDRSGTIRVELKPTPAGHIGIFPEHLSNFDQVLKLDVASRLGRPIRVLNLFSYTGVGSLQCALRGCDVTHVDASKPAVEWAKRNFARTQQIHPTTLCSIRFMLDDARAFCLREQRRGNSYDLICLDPPTYGHGPKGNAWRLDRDLSLLMEVIGSLLSDEAFGVMIAGHSDLNLMEDIVKSTVFYKLARRLKHHDRTDSLLITCEGKKLNAGYCYRWLRAD